MRNAHWSRGPSPLTYCFEVLMEGLMLIRLKHHDKNSTTTQQLEISLVIPEETSCSQMSYTAIKAMFGVL
jgi:nanoRNase/pAp phosphatase (c-di-AMP/oligoRNAs hydrolase)